MGSVYEAVQEPLGRHVALKVLHADFVDSSDAVTRFFHEARAVQIIQHPGLVQISDFGQLPDGSPYLVMELLRGETLAARRRRLGQLPVEQALRIAQQLASILQATHAHGIVHRDLKPGNVMLVSDSAVPGGERAKLLDFGIAKVAGAVGDSPLTRTGIAMGTPLYMSPEQCLGAASVDSKADVYSLGVVLFELLAGSPPFTAASDLALLNMHIQREPPPLRSIVPATPEQLGNLTQRMLSKDRLKRPDMAEVVAICARVLTLLETPGTRLDISPFALTQPSLPAPQARRGRGWLPWLMLIPIAGALWLLGQRFSPQAERSPIPLPTRAAAPAVAASVMLAPRPTSVPDLAFPADLAPSKGTAVAAPSPQPPRSRTGPASPRHEAPAAARPPLPPPASPSPEASTVYVD